MVDFLLQDSVLCEFYVVVSYDFCYSSQILKIMNPFMYILGVEYIVIKKILVLGKRIKLCFVDTQCF